jgi:hypothetical protein
MTKLIVAFRNFVNVRKKLNRKHALLRAQVLEYYKEAVISIINN